MEKIDTCLNCKKEIHSIEGRRKRKFCSDSCRSSYHQKNKPKQPKYVLRSTYEAVLAALKECQSGKAIIPITEFIPDNQAEVKPRSFAELLNAAKEWNRVDGLYAKNLMDEVDNSKLTAGQKSMIYSKLK